MSRELIFDLDGTLVDSAGVCVEVLSGMRAERGCDRMIDPIHARSFMSRGGTHMVAGLLGDLCCDPDRDLIEFRRRYAETTTSRDALFPGVAEGLAALRASGFRLSICSNKPQDLCDRVLADTGLAGLFDVVVGGQAGLRPKPAPDLLRATLAQLGAAPKDCQFIGDSDLDHQIADALQIPFLFVSYGYADHDWVPPSGAVFDSFTLLVESIFERPARARAA